MIALLYRASHWMHIDTECVEVRCDVVHDTATQCNVTLCYAREETNGTKYSLK